MTDMKSRQGMVLVNVLWMIALLSALVMATATTFRSFAGVMSLGNEKVQMQGLLTAGLEVSADMFRASGSSPILGIESTVALRTGQVRVRIDDEGGRIDIGKAPVELLSALFKSVRAPQPDTIAARIERWRRDQGGGRPATDAGTDSAQDDKLAGVNMPFNNVHDLAHVPGIRPEWIGAALPLATVYGNATINPMTAPPEVLAAIPGLNSALLRTFIALRRARPADAALLMTGLPGMEAYFNVKAPQAVSVNLRVTLNSGYAAGANAVIVLPPGDDQPYRVLTWTQLPLPE
jgi:general secretion pathway protein K